MLAMGHPSASLTLNHLGESAAVLEQDCLFAVVQSGTDGGEKGGREGSVHHLAAAQVLNVHDLNLGQFDVLITPVEPNVAVFSALRVVIALHGRCGGAEQDLRPEVAGEHYRRTAGMVARSRVLLFERRFVLLIHYDKSEIAERKEYG